MLTPADQPCWLVPAVESAKERPPALAPEDLFDRPLADPEHERWSSLLRRVREANHRRAEA